MISDTIRQGVLIIITSVLLLQPLSAAAQYAYPTASPVPTVSPTPMLSPSPTPTPAPTADEAADFESTVELDGMYIVFAEKKGDKSFETVPKLDLTKPEDKAKYDKYKDWVQKAISQAMQDTDLIKPYEAANIHVAVVDDLKAYLLANAEKFGLTPDLIAKLKDKDFKLESFSILRKEADGTVTHVILIDAEVLKNFAGVIAAVNRELQMVAMIEAGKKFATDLDQEIAILEATIASLEKVIAGMEKMVGADHPAVKGLKTLIEAQKAKLVELKKKKAAEPKPSPICTSPAPTMSLSPSSTPC